MTRGSSHLSGWGTRSYIYLKVFGFSATTAESNYEISAVFGDLAFRFGRLQLKRASSTPFFSTSKRYWESHGLSFQKRTRPSGFSGTISFYLSNSNRDDPADSSGDFDPQSNPAFCISPHNDANSPFSSVDLYPTEAADYYIEFYSDKECKNLVSTGQGAGEQCFTPR